MTMTPLSIAEWVDTDIKETVEQTLELRAARLFAVWEDNAGPQRDCVDLDPDPYRLLTRLPAWREVDGMALVMTGWMTKIADIDDETGETTEVDGEERVRVRVTAAVNGEGVSVVVRHFNDDGTQDSFQDGGEGMFPDALEMWWSAFAVQGPVE